MRGIWYIKKTVDFSKGFPHVREAKKMTKGRAVFRRVRSALFSAALALAGCNDGFSPQGQDLSANSIAASDRSPSAIPAAVASQDDYKISPLDVVEVTVYQVKELDSVARVSQTGYISLPLIGEVRASGKTVKQLEADIAARFGVKYLRSPNVRVTMKEFTSQRFTVEGAVNAPGVYSMAGQTSLLQAIAMARGLNRIAESDVAVFRIVDGKRTAARYNLPAIRDGQAEDPILSGGDVVVVGESAVRNAWTNFKDILGAGTGAAGLGLRLLVP